jgi:curved DNA-binding protein
MKKVDYYKILNLKSDATEEEIKRAYRRLAFQYHPDQNQRDGESEERFKEINEAYSVLGDPEKRRRFDRLGSRYSEGDHVSEQASYFRSKYGHQWGSNPPFGMGGMGCRRGGKFRGGCSFRFYKQEQPIFDEDMIYTIDISPAEACNGTERIIVARTIFGEKRFHLNIEAGVRNGTRVRLFSEDEEPLLGNLYVQINVNE